MNYVITLLQAEKKSIIEGMQTWPTEAKQKYSEGFRRRKKNVSDLNNAIDILSGKAAKSVNMNFSTVAVTLSNERMMLKNAYIDLNNIFPASHRKVKKIAERLATVKQAIEILSK